MHADLRAHACLLSVMSVKVHFSHKYCLSLAILPSYQRPFKEKHMNISLRIMVRHYESSCMRSSVALSTLRKLNKDITLMM